MQACIIRTALLKVSTRVLNLRERHLSDVGNRGGIVSLSFGERGRRRGRDTAVDTDTATPSSSTSGSWHPSPLRELIKKTSNSTHSALSTLARCSIYGILVRFFLSLLSLLVHSVGFRALFRIPANACPQGAARRRNTQRQQRELETSARRESGLDSFVFVVLFEQEF